MSLLDVHLPKMQDADKLHAVSQEHAVRKMFDDYGTIET